MLKFISFGSGSCGNCYYLYTEKEGLLIDAGIGLRTLKKRFQDYGLRLSDIHYILITHDHTDHVKSVGTLSADYSLPVYSTEKVHEGIKNNHYLKKHVAPEYTHIIERNRSFRLGEFTVTPFEIPHDSSDNVGYRVQYGDVVFCLMTDIGHIVDDIRKNISEAQYLVIEANHDVQMLRDGQYPAYLKQRVAGSYGHLSNSECAEALAKNATKKLKHVWLCHLSGENNHPELARKSVEHTLKEYGITAGEDFLLDVLGRKTPSEITDLY